MRPHAGVVKLVDTRGLGPRAAKRGGSSPLPGTIFLVHLFSVLS